jgi:hypothetical protein
MILAAIGGQRQRGYENGVEKHCFWKNLPLVKLEKVKVSINQDVAMEAEELPVYQDADMEAKVANMDAENAEEISVIEVEATTLELQGESTFIGVSGGMSRILVPKFYNDLWDYAEKWIDKRIDERINKRINKPSSKRSQVIVRMLIRGTPGTSKSVLGWYFIYKLKLKQKLGAFDLAYQHERSQLQTFYSKDDSVREEVTGQGSFVDRLTREDTVYIVDGASALVTNAMTFIFILPNPKAFKEIAKEPGMEIYYSKVWSKIDILVARKLLYDHIGEDVVLELY